MCGVVLSAGWCRWASNAPSPLPRSCAVDLYCATHYCYPSNRVDVHVSFFKFPLHDLPTPELGLGVNDVNKSLCLQSASCNDLALDILSD